MVPSQAQPRRDRGPGRLPPPGVSRVRSSAPITLFGCNIAPNTTASRSALPGRSVFESVAGGDLAEAGVGRSDAGWSGGSCGASLRGAVTTAGSLPARGV